VPLRTPLVLSSSDAASDIARYQPAKAENWAAMMIVKPRFVVDWSLQASGGDAAAR
jgi:hypothetical protein